MKTILTKTWRVLSLPRGIQLLFMRAFQDQFLIGVTGVIFNEKNEVLLFKHTYRQTQWSLPGGYIKSKEHPYEGLEREVEEESGLVVSAEEQLKIRTDRESARLDVTVVGKYIGGEFKPSHEVSEFGFFAFVDLPLISKNQLLLIENVLHDRKSKRFGGADDEEILLPSNESKSLLLRNKETLSPRDKPKTLFTKFHQWFN